MTTRANREKKDTFLQMLEQGIVMLHLDARRSGVIVPGFLQGDPALRLNIAHAFNLPALEIDDGGVYAVLSFRGTNVGCNIPWEAVYAMTVPDTAQDGVVWSTDVPADLSVVTAPAESKPDGPALSVVGGSDEPDAPGEGTPAPGRAHLRLVKD